MKDCTSRSAPFRHGGCANIDCEWRDLSTLIAIYKKCYGRWLNQTLKEYADLGWEDLIIRAASGKVPDGSKCDSHQRRIPKKSKEEMAKRLLAIKEKIKRSQTFDDLLSLIRAESINCEKYRELSVYDAALRIGSKRRLRPDRVYLHRGTLKGAVKLGLDVSKGYLDKRDILKELKKISPLHLENLLCQFSKKSYD